VAVDTNLVTPNLALQLGFAPSTTTLHRVLGGEINVNDAIHTHSSGLSIVPAGLTMGPNSTQYTTDFKDALTPLSGNGFDYVLMDCGAGLWGEVLKSVKAANDALIVTNAELPALVDALKAIKISERMGVNILGIIVTKVTGDKYEMKDETITGILKNYPILAKIPFDKNVPRSIALRKPLMNYKPNSPAARAYKKLAASLAGEEYKGSAFYNLVDFFRR